MCSKGYARSEAEVRRSLYVEAIRSVSACLLRTAILAVKFCTGSQLGVRSLYWDYQVNVLGSFRVCGVRRYQYRAANYFVTVNEGGSAIRYCHVFFCFGVFLRHVSLLRNRVPPRHFVACETGFGCRVSFKGILRRVVSNCINCDASYYSFRDGDGVKRVFFYVFVGSVAGGVHVQFARFQVLEVLIGDDLSFGDERRYATRTSGQGCMFFRFSFVVHSSLDVRVGGRAVPDLGRNEVSSTGWLGGRSRTIPKIRSLRSVRRRGICTISSQAASAVGGK